MSADDTNVLEVSELSIRYGREVVLFNVSLAVARGSVFALLGRNGTGRSSLVRCLLGTQKPRQGRTLLFGRDVWRERAALMQRVGVVPEDPDAPPELSPRQLSAFCARLYGNWDAAAVDDRFRRFEVPTERRFGQLSKGQKGR